MKKYNCCFVLLVILSMITLLFTSILAGKNNFGMEGDEVFSYISSTSMGGFKQVCFLEDQTWYDAAYFENALIATGEERFNVGMVVENQSMDTHPPLYYICLNFICSIFADEFSVWFGIGLNIIFAVLLGIGLYLLLQFFLNNRYMSLILSTIFCCSYLSVNMILFIRMYVLLSALVLFQSWFHLKLFDKVKKHELPVKENLGQYLALGIITILGALTHYYFLIYQCLIAFIYVLGLWMNEKRKDVCRYICTMMVSGMLYVCIYPAMLNHVFFKYRGREAVHKFLKEGTPFGAVISMLKIFDKELFKGCFWPIIIVLVFGTIILILRRRIGKRPLFKGITLSFPLCIYFFGISKASPYVSIRYVSPVAPLLFALVCVWAKYLIYYSNIRIIWKKFLCGFLCLFLFFTSFFFLQEPIKDAHYLEKKNTIDKMTEDVEYCIYVTADDYNWKMWEDYVIYPQFKGLFFIDGRYKIPIDDIKLKEQDKLVVFVDKALDNDEVFEYLKKYLDLNGYEVKYSSSFTDILFVRSNGEELEAESNFGRNDIK